MGILKGDTVLRLSHGKDIFFKVESIDTQSRSAMLRGLDVRLFADAPLSDLVKPSISEIANYKSKTLKMQAKLIARVSTQVRRGDKEKKNPSYLEVPGTVLHLDGDGEYVQICRKAYNDLQIQNISLFLPEAQQASQVENLLIKYNPDTLVLTGHDGMVKGGQDGPDNYHNARHFIEAVKAARRYRPSKDSLAIFAGACQSWYPGLMAAGANFASSPQRVLIHSLDPVMIVQKIAYTPLGKTVNIEEALAQSVTGPAGIGGIETRGQFRLGLPKMKE